MLGRPETRVWGEKEKRKGRFAGEEWTALGRTQTRVLVEKEKGEEKKDDLQGNKEE